MVWSGQSNVRKYYLSLPELEAGLKRVPDDWLFPEVAPNITIAPNDGVGEDAYIKQPPISSCDPDTVGDMVPYMPNVTG